MASLARIFRTVVRRSPKRSPYSTDAIKVQEIKKAGQSSGEISEAYDAETTNWKFMSYFGVFPAVAIGYYNAYYVVEEEEHGPPFDPETPGMRVRRKPFPWGDGDHSLFHNPKMNAISTGYEEE